MTKTARSISAQGCPCVGSQPDTLPNTRLVPWGIRAPLALTPQNPPSFSPLLKLLFAKTPSAPPGRAAPVLGTPTQPRIPWGSRHRVPGGAWGNLTPERVPVPRAPCTRWGNTIILNNKAKHAGVGSQGHPQSPRAGGLWVSPQGVLRPSPWPLPGCRLTGNWRFLPQISFCHRAKSEKCVKFPSQPRPGGY